MRPLPRLGALTALLLSALALALQVRPATAGASDGPLRASAFLQRVFAHLPKAPTEEYTFQPWEVAGNPTKEGFGLLRVEPGVDPEAVIARIMAVDQYKANLARLQDCRSIPDPRFKAPGSVRFYMRVDLEPFGYVQHELALLDGGTREGYRVAFWYDLQPETTNLDPSQAARSAYSVGAWLVSKDYVGYAVSNAPVREDVSSAKWALLTTGADASAKMVVKTNIEKMVAWSRR